MARQRRWNCAAGVSKSDRESDCPCALLQRRKRFKAVEHLMRRQLKPAARRQGLITASGAGAAARSCPRAHMGTAMHGRHSNV